MKDGSGAARRVAHVIPNLDVGGAEVLVTRMVGWQIRNAVEPLVYCLENEGEMAERVRAAGVTLRCISRRPGPWDRRAIATLARYCAEDSLALIHSHNFEAFFYCALASRRTGVPLLHTQHGRIIPYGFKQRMKLRLSRNYCNRFVGVSEPITRFAIEQRWTSESGATTILNGVDTDAYKPDVAERSRVREVLSIDSAAPVAICVARIAPVKDHQTLITGFSRSEMSRSGHLLIVGDGPLRKQTEAIAEQSGRSERIRFLGERHDVRSLLVASDLFAMTSISEGISVSLLEAMACGVVPLVTAVGGNLQIVTDALDNGMLIPPSSAEAVAEGFDELLADRLRLDGIGERARQSVISRFGQEPMMRAYLDCYDALTEPSRVEAEAAG